MYTDNYFKQKKTLIDNLNTYFNVKENLYTEGVKISRSSGIYAFDKKSDKVVSFIRIRAIRRIGSGLEEDIIIREVIRNYTDSWKAEEWQSFENFCKENL